jgi:hypothetical protein
MEECCVALYIHGRIYEGYFSITAVPLALYASAHPQTGGKKGSNPEIPELQEFRFFPEI